MKDFSKILCESVLDTFSHNECFVIFEAQQGNVDDIPNEKLRDGIKKLIADKIILQKNGGKYFFKFNKSSNLEDIKSFVKDFNFTHSEHDGHEIFTFKDKKFSLKLQSSTLVIRTTEDGQVKSVNKGMEFEGELAHRLANYINVPIDKVDDELVKRIMNVSGIIMLTSVDQPKNASKRTDLKDFPKGELPNRLRAMKIGATLTDITIRGKTESGNTHRFLSVKAGKVIKYVNKGIGKGYFTDENFTNKKSKLSDKADQLLTILGMPPKSKERRDFFDMFAMYINSKNGKVKEDDKKDKSPRKVVDLTNKIQKDDLLHIIQSGIGYGYIFVHKITKNHIEVANMINKNVLEKFDKIEKAWADFGYQADGMKKGKKQFEMFLKMKSGNYCKITMRDAHGKIRPTEFMIEWLESLNAIGQS